MSQSKYLKTDYYQDQLDRANWIFEELHYKIVICPHCKETRIIDTDTDVAYDDDRQLLSPCYCCEKRFKVDNCPEFFEILPW